MGTSSEDVSAGWSELITVFEDAIRTCALSKPLGIGICCGTMTGAGGKANEIGTFSGTGVDVDCDVDEGGGGVGTEGRTFCALRVVKILHISCREGNVGAAATSVDTGIEIGTEAMAV